MQDCHLQEGAGRSPEDRSEKLGKELTLLSSVAYGATPFLRKGADYCGGAAITTFGPEGR